MCHFGLPFSLLGKLAREPSFSTSGGAPLARLDLRRQVIEHEHELLIALAPAFDLPHRMQDRRVVPAPEAPGDFGERACGELTCKVDGDLPGLHDRRGPASRHDIVDRDAMMRRYRAD